jgi:hypothetical protein
MPETDRDKDEPASGTAIVSGTAMSSATPERPDLVVEEEEKVLAGRHDANIPALLTKDVLGG